MSRPPSPAATAAGSSSVPSPAAAGFHSTLRRSPSSAPEWPPFDPTPSSATAWLSPVPAPWVGLSTQNAARLWKAAVTAARSPRIRTPVDDGSAAVAASASASRTPRSRSIADDGSAASSSSAAPRSSRSRSPVSATAAHSPRSLSPAASSATAARGALVSPFAHLIPPFIRQVQPLANFQPAFAIPRPGVVDPGSIYLESLKNNLAQIPELKNMCDAMCNLQEYYGSLKFNCLLELHKKNLEPRASFVSTNEWYSVRAILHNSLSFRKACSFLFPLPEHKHDNEHTMTADVWSIIHEKRMPHFRAFCVSCGVESDITDKLDNRSELWRHLLTINTFQKLKELCIPLSGKLCLSRPGVQAQFTKVATNFNVPGSSSAFSEFITSNGVQFAQVFYNFINESIVVLAMGGNEANLKYLHSVLTGVCAIDWVPFPDYEHAKTKAWHLAETKEAVVVPPLQFVHDSPEGRPDFAGTISRGNTLDTGPATGAPTLSSRGILAFQTTPEGQTPANNPFAYTAVKTDLLPGISFRVANTTGRKSVVGTTHDRRHTCTFTPMSGKEGKGVDAATCAGLILAVVAMHQGHTTDPIPLTETFDKKTSNVEFHGENVEEHIHKYRADYPPPTFNFEYEATTDACPDVPLCKFVSRDTSALVKLVGHRVMVPAKKGASNINIILKSWLETRIAQGGTYYFVVYKNKIIYRICKEDYDRLMILGTYDLYKYEITRPYFVWELAHVTAQQKSALDAAMAEAALIHSAGATTSDQSSSTLRTLYDSVSEVTTEAQLECVSGLGGHHNNTDITEVTIYFDTRDSTVYSITVPKWMLMKKYLKYKNKYLKLKDPNHKLLTPKDISNMSQKELNVKYLKYKNKYNQIKLEKSMNRLKITYN
jgi:hypothetical protein